MILDDAATHGNYLKSKLQIEGVHPPGGRLFHPDGVTVTTSDKALTVLELDTGGTYRVLSSYAVP